MSQKDEQKKLFEKVIEEHKGIVFKVARTYCPDEHDRPDLVQEILIQLWLSFHKYNERYRLTTWMYRIALNTAISFYRKSTSRKKDTIQMDEQLAAIAENNIAAKEQELHLLEKCIHELKEIDRAVMLLYLEERSYKEIAEILGISATNVSTKVARIKKSIQQKFTAIKN